MDPHSTKHLASHYECPVCYDYVQPPIFQCQNGHLVCSNCSPKLECCPTCKGQLGVSRSLLMEKMLDTIIFTCKYSFAGCQTTMLLKEKSAHEDKCLFVPSACIICHWEGGKVLTHMRQEHPTVVVEGNHCTYSVTNEALQSPSPNHVVINSSIKLLNCFDRHFVFCLSKEKNANDQFNFIVTAFLLAGSLDDASKFTYKVKLRGRYHRKVWESTPLPKRDNGIPASIASTLTIEKYGSRVFDITTIPLFAVNDVITFHFEIVHQSPDF